MAQPDEHDESTASPWNPEHPSGTCADCGKEMVHNVPRLGSRGGYVHKDTMQMECNTPHTQEAPHVSRPHVTVGCGHSSLISSAVATALATPPAMLEPPLPRPARPPHSALMALTAWLLQPPGALAGLPRFKPSAYSVRHDPNRPKTQADLEAMKAAEERRRRKAERKARRA